MSDPLRELDVLIATRIFGWESAGEKQMWSIGENYGDPGEPDGTAWMGQLPPELRTHPEQHLFLPCYSTDIAAALTVVQRITQEDDGRAVEFMVRYSPYSRRWLAQFHALTRKMFAQASADTAAHAICAAALRTIAAVSPEAPHGGTP